MKISKRNKIIFGTGILLIVIVLIASSYAIWQLVRTQTDENEIATGCFDVTYTEKSAAINLEDAYPITDEEGMESDPYTFTIKNTCGMYAEYQINLEILPVAENRLLSEYVKAGLNDKIYTLTATNEVSPTIDTALESYKLISGGLKKNQEKTFDLRLWMDEDTSLSEGSNKFFKSKITVIAVPGEEPYSTSFGSTTGDILRSVISTSDGEYVAVGYTTATSKDGDLLTNHKGNLRDGHDALIVKFNKKGSLVWSNSFGSTTTDWFYSATSTGDGGYVAVGNTTATSSNGDFLINHKGTLRGGQDALIVKYDVNGNLVWSNSFGSTVVDGFQSVTTTPDGGFIAVGDTEATSASGDLLTNHKSPLKGADDALIVKYDSNGNLEWSNSFGSSKNDKFNSLFLTEDGGFIAVGQTNATSKDGDFLTSHKGTLRGNYDALIVKYDANGDLVWSNNFGSTVADYFQSVTTDTDGGLVAVGYTVATSPNGDFSLASYKGTLRGAQDSIIAKYDATGDLVWSNGFGSTAVDIFHSITTTPDGGFIAVGESSATGKDGDFALVSYKGTLRGGVDGPIVKYDTNGNLVWSNSFGSTVSDYFLSITTTPDGRFVAVGTTAASVKDGDLLANHKGALYGGNEGLIVKFDSDGYFSQQP